MAGDDREPVRREKGPSIKGPIVSHSAIIKADNGERMQYTVASTGRQKDVDNAAQDRESLITQDKKATTAAAKKNI